MLKRLDRTVKVEDQDVEIYVTRPTNAVAREAEIYRIKKFNELIAQGLKTKRQCMQQMRELGEWTDRDEAAELRIATDIMKKEKELFCGDGKSKPKLSTGQALAIEIRVLRSELRELSSRKINAESASAESIADDSKFDYLVANCTFYKSNGKKVYNTFEEYNQKSADELAFTAAAALAQLMYNITDDFEEQLPENRFLANFGLVNEELSLIDPKTGNTVDLDGRTIDEDGYYLDESGNRVDSEGNRIAEDGLYEIVEYENDLVEEKPKKKPRRTTTKTKNSDS